MRFNYRIAPQRCKSLIFNASHHSLLPRSIVIHVNHCTRTLEQGQPPGYYKLNPSRHDVNTTVGGHSFSMKLCTYPLLPSYALTVEKIQGSTLDGIILGTLHHKSRKSYSAALLYVALSRVRKLSDLYLSEKLTMEDIRAPSQKIIDEITRLESIPSFLE